MLLLRRMAALDIDHNNVRRIEPEVLRDLQNSCSGCESYRQCAVNLDGDAANQAWQDYCPNVATLNALSALPWMMRSHD